jgi:hypothetical protein
VRIEGILVFFTGGEGAEAAVADLVVPELDDIVFIFIYFLLFDTQ